MTKLTDSFCERCGSRYAFVANESRGPLRGARDLARGLKNFVFTDGQSISDAMDLARDEGDHEVSSRIAEAFHRTFNLCMSCRQYACDRCWNEAAGECLSCAPAPKAGLDVPVAGGSAPAAGGTDPVESTIPSGLAPLAWPAEDLAVGQALLVAGSDQSNGGNGDNSNNAVVDLGAVDAWPAADSLRPDMPLTPAELAIVEAHLSRAPVYPVIEAEAVSATPLLEERQTWWNSTPPDGDEPASTNWALDDSTVEDEPPGERALPAAASGAASAEAGELVEDSHEEPADEAPTLETEVLPESPRLLRITSAPQSMPLPTPPERHPNTRQPGGMVGRLLGRRASETEPPAEAAPRDAAERRGQSHGRAWPNATAWSERSPDGRHSRLEAEPPAGPDPISESPLDRGTTLLSQTQNQPAAQPPAGTPTAVPAANIEIGTRAAAALRVSAVKAAIGHAAPPEAESDAESRTPPNEVPLEPTEAGDFPAESAASSAETQPLVDLPDAPPTRRPSPAREAAWLRVQRESAEPESSSSLEVAPDAPPPRQPRQRRRLPICPFRRRGPRGRPWARAGRLTRSPARPGRAQIQHLWRRWWPLSMPRPRRWLRCGCNRPRKS